MITLLCLYILCRLIGIDFKDEIRAIRKGMALSLRWIVKQMDRRRYGYVIG